MTASVSFLPLPAPASTSYFAGVSHHPERRARMEEDQLSERLAAITIKAETLAAMPGAQPLPAGLVAGLVAKHEAATRSYWLSVGRTMSAAIVGPARFPADRNRKRMDIADRRATEALEDHRRALRRLEGVAFPFGLPGSAIRSDDPDALEKLRARIEDVKASWSLNKELGALARREDWQAIGARIGRVSTLRAVSDAARGFRPFSVDGFSAEVKRLERRVADLESRSARATVERDVAGVVVVENGEIGRVQLIFPGKPDEATRSLLKSRGFVFSPSQGAWQRQLNNAGIAAAEYVLAQRAREDVARKRLGEEEV